MPELCRGALQEQGPWKGIVAIARGGLVPAQIVARELEVRLIDTICISSYDDQVRRNPKIPKKCGMATEKAG